MTSIYHLAMKFPTPMGVGCVKGCQYDSRKCYSKVMKSAFKEIKVEDADEEMLDFKEENVKETSRSFRSIWFTQTSLNMIFTVQFPDDDMAK